MNKHSNILTKREKDLLQELLGYSLNEPNKCIINRFRLDHLSDRDLLDKFTSKKLLSKKDNDTKYELTHMGVYLIDSELSNQIYDDMNIICNILRKGYMEEIGKPILISTIGSEAKLEKSYLHFCISLLNNLTPMSLPNDLNSNKANITPNEQLFDFKKTKEIPDKNIGMWFPSANTKNDKRKPHGNSKINAIKREAVLGAALSVLAQYPQLCVSKEGNIQAGKIAEQVDKNSILLFPQYDGEPPLARSTITDLITENLKLLRE